MHVCNIGSKAVSGYDIAKCLVKLVPMRKCVCCVKL